MMLKILLSGGLRFAEPCHPGDCQQILRNHGYAIDFWTTSFTDSIWRRA